MSTNKYGFKEIFFREIKYIKHSRAGMFITFIGPVLSLVLVYFIFKQGVPRDLPVAVVDNDYSQLSHKINRMIDATSIAASDRNYNSLKEAQAALEKGSVDAIVYIPEGLDKNVRTGGQADIILYINNVNVLKAGLLNSGLRKALLTISTGIKINQHLAKGNTYNQSYEKSLPIAVSSKILFNPYLNYSYFLASALMPMLLVLFILLSSVYSIGRELRYGSAQAIVEDANISFPKILFAKLLPYTISGFTMAMLMNYLLFYMLGMPLRGSFIMIILSEILLIVSYQFLAILFLALLKNMRLVLSIASAYSMMALTFSGLTFPLYGMPEGAQTFAQIFPFTHWLQIFIGQALRNEPIMYSMSSVNLFFIFIIAGLLCIPRLRDIYISPRFWGKE